jgi:hypothetical protein
MPVQICLLVGAFVEQVPVEHERALVLAVLSCKRIVLADIYSSTILSRCGCIESCIHATNLCTGTKVLLVMPFTWKCAHTNKHVVTVGGHVSGMQPGWVHHIKHICLEFVHMRDGADSLPRAVLNSWRSRFRVLGGRAPPTTQTMNSTSPGSTSESPACAATCTGTSPAPCADHCLLFCAPTCCAEPVSKPAQWFQCARNQCDQTRLLPCRRLWAQIWLIFIIHESLVRTAAAKPDAG